MFYLLIPVIVLCILLIKILHNRKPKLIENKHVVITGGSSGIGKAVAILAAEQGAHVTIIARNLVNLAKAEREIKEKCKNTSQKINSLSIDVSNQEAIECMFNEIEETIGPIYMLINCAGLSICGKLEDLTVGDINIMLDVNFLGTVYPVRAIIPKFKRRKEGIIIITASQAGLMGIFGFSIYASTKFALRGLAESLDMEMRPYNVSVTLALPPDTDTPGFENENKTKPIETSLISESGGLFKPEEVAKKMLNDALKGHFFSYVGFESFLLTTLCVGMSPFTSMIEVLWQALLLGPFRIISSFYVSSFQRIIKNCIDNKTKNK